ncbi:MAG: hypothetical protein ACTHY0_09585, partial [Mammaliicoccus vitulinus]|uniref:hypothetical protein n=1 Tax=Mammaliicoccus vitulinus TaxID=71237 RepID=UPI003F974E94
SSNHAVPAGVSAKKIPNITKIFFNIDENLLRKVDKVLDLNFVYELKKASETIIVPDAFFILI